MDVSVYILFNVQGSNIISITVIAKLSDECKIWLSNNQDKAELGETDEETLAKTLRLLLKAYNEDRGVAHDKLEICRAAQEDDMKLAKNAKTQRMLSQITYTKMLVDAAKWGQHFRCSFLFKPTVMHDRVIKVHAGVRFLYKSVYQ
jgi:hypothetical protein